MKYAAHISWKQHLAYICAAVIISSVGFYADIYLKHLQGQQIRLATTQLTPTQLTPTHIKGE